MQYRRMGTTSLQVSELALGTWLNFGPKLHGAEASKYVQVALDAGVNLIDTAESYEGGEVESMLGKILRESGRRRDTYCLCTKLFYGAIKREDRAKLQPTQHGLSRKHLVEGCSQSLQRLGLDYIDILLCHRHDSAASYEELAWTMHMLVLQGKILYWGTSEWEPEQIREVKTFCHDNGLIGPSIEQPQYNLLHKERINKLLNHEALASQLGLITWSPLASGLLTGRYDENPDRAGRLNDAETRWVRGLVFGDSPAANFRSAREISSVAKELGVSTPQLAIAWCLKNPAVSSVILGGSSVEQLRENLDAVNLQDRLDPAIMRRLNEAGSAPGHQKG